MCVAGVFSPHTAKPPTGQPGSGGGGGGGGPRMFKTKSSHAQTKPNEGRENTEGKDGAKYDVNDAVVCFHFSHWSTPNKQEGKGRPAQAGLQHR